MSGFLNLLLGWGVPFFFTPFVIKWHIDLSRYVKVCPWIIQALARERPWMSRVWVAMAILNGVLAGTFAWQHDIYAVPSTLAAAWFLRLWWYSRPPRPPRKRALAALRARAVPS